MMSFVKIKRLEDKFIYTMKTRFASRQDIRNFYMVRVGANCPTPTHLGPNCLSNWVVTNKDD